MLLQQLFAATGAQQPLIAPRRSPEEEARLDEFFGFRPLVPLFPIGGFSPGSTCPHHGPLPEGSALTCMVCHRSGMDQHPAYRRDRRFDPRPERGDPANPRYRRSLA